MCRDFFAKHVTCMHTMDVLKVVTKLLSFRPPMAICGANSYPGKAIFGSEQKRALLNQCKFDHALSKMY